MVGWQQKAHSFVRRCTGVGKGSGQSEGSGLMGRKRQPGLKMSQRSAWEGSICSLIQNVSCGLSEVGETIASQFHPSILGRGAKGLNVNVDYEQNGILNLLNLKRKSTIHM